MSRLIDANALLEKMYKYSDNEGAKMPYGDDDSLIHRDSVCFLIEKAPTINPEPHWIPVTERLPKPRESVIISVNGKYGDWIGEGCYWETTENHVIWKGYRWNATYWDDEIIAWMPLPEPFKEVTK